MHRIKSLLLSLVLTVATHHVQASTTIVCILSGSGTTDLATNMKRLEIEQTITFNEDFVEEWSHRFLTDYDFMEQNLIYSGESFDWLSFKTFVTDQYIKISSKINKVPPLEFIASNVRILAYTMEISVSRSSGISVASSNLSFTAQVHELKHYQYVYHASGKCIPAAKKF
jgi:hypothetical protein